MGETRLTVAMVFTFGVLLLINACAVTHEKPFSFHVPEGDYWQDTVLSYLVADGGVRLAYRESGDISAHKAVILVPGSTMYGYYYIPFIKGLSGEDTYVRAIDLRGHGDSEGPRGDVPHEDALVEDLNKHIEQIQSANPQGKIIISGHSMGAGICGRYLEKYGYDSVHGAIYLAPFFHWRQPGMKPARYVDVNIFKTIFGNDHEVTQVYHPSSKDPKLVREYTKMMSKASMVKDYRSFRINHTTPSLYLIGKNDELFDWEKSPGIFKNRENMQLLIVDQATHLDIHIRASRKISQWLDNL